MDSIYYAVSDTSNTSKRKQRALPLAGDPSAERYLEYSIIGSLAKYEELQGKVRGSASPEFPIQSSNRSVH